MSSLKNHSPRSTTGTSAEPLNWRERPLPSTFWGSVKFVLRCCVPSFGDWFWELVLLVVLIAVWNSTSSWETNWQLIVAASLLLIGIYLTARFIRWFRQS